MMSGKVRSRGDACLDDGEGGAAKRPAAGGAGAERPSNDEAERVALDADGCSGGGAAISVGAVGGAGGGAAGAAGAASGGGAGGAAAVDDSASPLLRMLCVGGAREALFTALNTKDAAALRATSLRLREEVAQHQWDGAPLPPVWCKSLDDASPRVRHDLAGWCASFPRARQIKIFWRPKDVQKYMHELPLLSKLERVRLVMLTSVYSVQCVDLSSLRGVRELVVKTSEYCHPTSTSRQVLLGDMPSIAHLELHRCSFDSRALEALTSLQTLVVVSCSHFDSGVLRHLPNLVELDLSRSRFNGEDLAALTKLRMLRTEYVYEASVPGVRLKDVHLAPLTRLEQLSLHYEYEVTGATLLGMPNLTHVSLRRCVKVTNAVVRALWAVMALKPTRCELVLTGCMLLTTACVPVEYGEPTTGDLADAFRRMTITREGLVDVVRDAMILAGSSRTDDGVFVPLPTAAEASVAADEHVKLHAIVNNLVVSEKMGNVVVDISIDH